MDVDFKELWVAVGELASVEFVQQLQREVTEGHPLWNAKLSALAQRCDMDDVLFAVEREGQPAQYAVVHLTWRGGPELAPDWPSVALYRSLDEWVRDGMEPDHAESVSE